jgi:hypothetical protein
MSKVDKIENLEKRLKSLTIDLYELSPSSLEILSRMVSELELMRLLEGMDVEDYEDILSQYDLPSLEIESEIDQYQYEFPPETELPANYGKKWIEGDLKKLDSYLKTLEMDVGLIAVALGRTESSILSKAAALINDQVVKYGYDLHLAMAIYHNKVSLYAYDT